MENTHGDGSAEMNLWTIGHSRHELSVFLDLLSKFEIQVVVDVRSYPTSKLAPQFNEGSIRKALKSRSIEYIFMGKELGGRPDEVFMYDEDGKVLYNKVAESERFQSGIARLTDGAKKYRVAIMCSEGKPDGCHRHLLIGRVLSELKCRVINILPVGETVDYAALVPDEMQFSLLDVEEVKPWKSLLSVRQESPQSDSSDY